MSRNTGRRAVTVAITMAAVAVGVLERPRLLIGFLICALVFVPLEQLVPLVQRTSRPDWAVDVVHTFANRLPITIAVAVTLGFVGPAVHAVFPDAVRRFVLDQPGWVRFTVLILLADLANYLGHRALHEIGPLWRLHAVHHSSTGLDWLSTSRGHPLDQIINLVVTVVPLYAIGFDVTFSAVFIAFQFYFPFLAHANTRITLRPLSAVFVTPAFHHWHHALEPAAVNRNYGAILSVWDRLFRTRHLPPGMPGAYGIAEAMPASWLGQLAAPFQPRRDTAPALPTAVAGAGMTTFVREGSRTARAD
ncbi:sterol desaturase family protein [Parafrankia discariae]|uniref:sterol desaturase family protein n=1 Tax=Parafrankia discariae TaxID=365528 RepID=UPI00036B6BD2|nr:sterol desaturase family protein [Parafrankia discariae]